jgi:cell division protein FtsZ
MLTFGGDEAEHPVIRVVGCGGAGCNIIRELSASQVPQMELVFLNHDHELKDEQAHQATPVGLNYKHVMAPGPEHAEEATWRRFGNLGKVLKGADLTFIVCGLGGTTGSGSAPAVAEMSRAQNAVTLALTVHPFNIEGVRRSRNTQWCLDRLRSQAHSVVCIQNEKLMSIAPDISFGQALAVTNKMALMPIQEIAAIATRADIGKILKVMDCDEVHIGFGGGNRKDGLAAAVNEVVDSLMPGPKAEAKNWDRGLITVRAGPDITDEEVEHMVGSIAGELHPDGTVLWGVIRDDGMGDMVRIMTILGKGTKKKDKVKKDRD